MMNLSRRDFLKTSLLATTGSMLVPRFLKAWENPIQRGSDRILIVLQLSGGNDGLNTVVPYRNDLYYKWRPKLALPPDKIIKLSDELALNNALEKLHLLYDRGHVGIFNNVGYPNPDRSHFRSMDIWQSASGSAEYVNTGWIGRYLDSQCDGCGAHSAIEIDDTLSLALKGASVKGMAVKDPAKLYRAAQAPFFKTLSSDFSPAHPEENVAYLYKTLAETVSNSDYIYSKSKVYQTKTEYPDTDFGKRLKTIGELIGSGVNTRVYYAALSGFDTHVRQSGTQERQLKTFADAVYALVTDLESTNNFERVVIMTFSEFGRRVSENASGGTDHGTANNLFLIGKKISAGILNETPNLQDLDNNDLIFQIDFRSIYATLLRKWLSVDEENIVNGKFPVLDFI